MHEDRPSGTASAVAMCRALTSLPSSGAPASDPFAKALLPRSWRRAVETLERLDSRPLAKAVRLCSLGFLDHIALRTARIDEAVTDACARGADQLVILGAGFDARAYRLDVLRGVDVYEVDHPATQRTKLRRVAHLAARARSVRHVAIDFARERIDERLAREGHDAGRRTVWIWEGVVPYLPREAVRATLSAIAARSAPGSTLAITYGTPGERPWLVRLRKPIERAFHRIGEPLHTLVAPAEMAALLEGAGLRVAADDGPREWRRRYRYGLSPMLFVEERFVLAERD